MLSKDTVTSGFGVEDPLASPPDPHHDALVGVRTADEGVLLETIGHRPTALFCRQQRHHGLECMHAEVLALRRPDPVRLGHFEVVAELEPTDGAAFDALDGDAQVVEPRFRHAKARIGGSARRFHLASGRVWADDRRCAFLRVSPTRRVP